MSKAIKLPLNKPEESFGVIVLAHGGGTDWDNNVKEASLSIAKKYPTIAIFGMAQVPKIQPAVDTLLELGINKILVIPLYISSHSELYRQTEFVLGLRENPDPDFVEGMERVKKNIFRFILSKIRFKNIPYILKEMKNHKKFDLNAQVQSKAEIILNTALNDDELIANIIEERTLEISKNPENETVIIVGHGPINDEDDKKWLSDMANLSQGLQKHGFQNILVATMRDDAPKEVNTRASKELRELVENSNKSGFDTIVVPLFLSKSVAEKEISKILKSLKYKYSGNTLLPHKDIGQWLEKSCGKVVFNKKIR